MYVCYYYYFLFSSMSLELVFFVMQYAMSTFVVIFLMSKETLFQICQKCNQYSPPAAKICKYEGCKTMFPFKQFNWSEIDNMGVTNPTHQRELLEKRVTINTTLKKLKYHGSCSSRTFTSCNICKRSQQSLKTILMICKLNSCFGNL